MSNQIMTLLIHEARFINYSNRQEAIQVVITYGSEKYSTAYKSNEQLNPKWNHEIKFTLVKGPENINLEIRDQVGTIGQNSLNVAELLSNNLNDWFCLFDKQQITGSIRLTFQFQVSVQQMCIDKLDNLMIILENKLRSQRITSPTVGSLQLLQQYLTSNKYKHNKSNIISNDYQAEFELSTIKSLMNDIQQLQQKFKLLDTQSAKVNRLKEIQAKQKELANLMEQVNYKREEIQQQREFFQSLEQRQTIKLSKKELILLKYQKKQQTLVQLKKALSEPKLLKRGHSLAVQRTINEDRRRLYSELQS